MNGKIKTLFTVSVIFNLLLLGAVGGMAYKHFSPPPFKEVYTEMSPEARNIVARTMQAAFRDGRAGMESAREIKTSIREILSAETFDAEAFDAQAEKLHTIMSAMGHKRIEVTKELAQQLSQEDRKVLAEKFAKGFHGHDRRHHKGKPHSFMDDHKGHSQAVEDGEGKDRRAATGALEPAEPPAPVMPDDMPPPPDIE